MTPAETHSAVFEETRTERIQAEGIRFSHRTGDVEVGRATLYVLQNDLHTEPLGLLEDLYVEEDQRGAGIGTTLVEGAKRVAKGKGCYKLVATSRLERPEVHELYERLGFERHGYEFRMDL